jgi:release factor glutamine methyltransferase
MWHKVRRGLAWWRFQLFQRHRHNRLVLEKVEGRPILVLPGVFNPKLFWTGAFLAGTLDENLVRDGSSVLDMGTGSGVGAVFAARWAQRVVAVDINPAAVRCARINALLNQVDDRVQVCQGDLYATLQDQRFDVVLFNPPFFRGKPRDPLDQAWHSDDVVERFACGLSDHLNPGGCALVVLSSVGDEAAFLEAFRSHGLAVKVVAQLDRVNETLTIYELRCQRDRSLQST